MNTKARGPKPAVNISDKLNDESNLYGKKTPPQIRINRVLAISLYGKLGNFYRPSPSTVFISIMPSKVTSPMDN